MKIHKPFTLVVGSGGIKPLAALPFFSFLEEYNLKPELIIACSGGACTSCFWMSGPRTEEAAIKKLNIFVSKVVHEKLFGNIDLRTLLSIPGYPFGRFNKKNGILFNDKLLKMYQELSDYKRLEDLPVKTILTATDVETGDPVFIEKGDMGKAICATTALYPILPPIEIGGKLLVDGAYHSEVPLMEAVKRNHNNVIIALEFDSARTIEQNGFLNFVNTFIQNVLHQHTHKQNAFALNLHQKEIIFAKYFFEKPIKFWDVHVLDEIMEVGRKVINEKKREILDTLFH